MKQGADNKNDIIYLSGSDNEALTLPPVLVRFPPIRQCLTSATFLRPIPSHFKAQIPASKKGVVTEKPMGEGILDISQSIKLEYSLILRNTDERIMLANGVITPFWLCKDIKQELNIKLLVDEVYENEQIIRHKHSIVAFFNYNSSLLIELNRLCATKKDSALLVLDLFSKLSQSLEQLELPIMHEVIMMTEIGDLTVKIAMQKEQAVYFKIEKNALQVLHDIAAKIAPAIVQVRFG